MSDPATDETTIVVKSDTNPMPVIDVWPECTECGSSWCLRRAWSFSKGWIWVWGPECKCGRRKRPDPAPPRLVTIDGPVPT